MDSYEQLRCPNQACCGWVCEVENNEDTIFYGCGNCGKVWNNINDLYTEISDIIQKYNYRLSVYKKQSRSFSPVDIDDEQDNYEELVATEWDSSD